LAWLSDGRELFYEISVRGEAHPRYYFGRVWPLVPVNEQVVRRIGVALRETGLDPTAAALVNDNTVAFAQDVYAGSRVRERAFTAWVSVVMCGATSSAAVMQRPAKAAIRGVVLTKGTDEPIAGAWVILTKYSTKESMYAPFLTIPITPSATSDRDGRFEIHDI